MFIWMDMLLIYKLFLMDPSLIRPQPHKTTVKPHQTYSPAKQCNPPTNPRNSTTHTHF